MSRKAVLYGLLIIITFLGSGCQLARLFQFKNQLRYFDSYMHFDTPNSIYFKTPILTGEDIQLLSGTPPHSKTPLSEEAIRWTYKLRKLPSLDSTETALEDLDLDLYFRNDTLYRAVYAPRLSQLITQKTLRQGLMALGDGTYEEGSRQLQPGKRSDGLNWDLSELPKQSDFLKALGTPTETKTYSHDSAWIYRFEEIGPDGTVIGNPSILAFFDSETMRLTLISTTLIGPRIIFRF